MRFIPDLTRRFKTRPFFENYEMEAECEACVSDFLIAVRGEVAYPIATDDLTVLIERFAELDLYADLSPFGDDVQGLTKFASGKKPEVLIDRRLSEDSRRVNRLRTTLAHEFGHVRLHNILFQREAGGLPLFGDALAFEQSCKPASMTNASFKDWMEWQAGYVCTALLAPGRQVARVLEEAAIQPGPLNPEGVAASTAIEATSSAFGISREAARVRLSVLGRLADGRQGSLLQP